MIDDWKGVRPVRYSQDIFDSIMLLVEHDSITVDELRLLLINSRNERERKRLNTLQIRKSTKSKIRKKEEFLTKTEQLIRVFRHLNLLTKNNDCLVPTENAKKIADLLNKNKKLDAATLFLQLLFASPFETYLFFIERLIDIDIIIPKEFEERNKEFSSYLEKHGVYLDSWSFYIIRDLFYEFGLLNYVFLKNEQKIFAVCTFEPKQKKYLQKIHTKKGIIYNYPVISNEKFIQNLQEIYLMLTEKQWGVLVRFIDLRERFSEKYLISENHFNDLITKNFSKTVNGLQITLNVGLVKPSERVSKAIKMINSPFDKSGIPFTLIRIRKVG